MHAHTHTPTRAIASYRRSIDFHILLGIYTVYSDDLSGRVSSSLILSEFCMKHIGTVQIVCFVCMRACHVMHYQASPHPPLLKRPNNKIVRTKLVVNQSQRYCIYPSGNYIYLNNVSAIHCVCMC